jgi:hypothetical protein
MLSTRIVALCVCLLAAIAGCQARSGTNLIPPGALRPSSAQIPETLVHAPCTLLGLLKRPTATAPIVTLAFGQLMEKRVNKVPTRYASTGVRFANASGKRVLASTGGVARGYADLPGYGQTIVVRTASGAETLYGDLSSFAIHFPKDNRVSVKAGQVIAYSGKTNLAFAYAPSGGVLGDGTQINPCGTGSSNGAAATINLLPANIAVYARMHSLSVDGVMQSPGPYPAGNPDVATPSTIVSANVAKPTTLGTTVYERSDQWSDYYVVLCGNAVFATGPARYAGPFSYPWNDVQVPLATPALPKVVFFRDAGTQGNSLVMQLPAPSPEPNGAPCPAPPPANTYTYTSTTFYAPGQTVWLRYVSNNGQSGDTVAFTSDDATVAIASPSPLSVYATSPPAWPPGNHTNLIAKATGSTTISVYDSSCGCSDPSIAITVVATPSPAPVPTPIPNI